MTAPSSAKSRRVGPISTSSVYHNDASQPNEKCSGRKKFDYFATPSIRQYAIIEQDARRVDLYTRSGDRWMDEIVEGDAALTLSSIGVEISLDAIYEDTELDATRPREGGRQAPAL